MSHWWNKLKKIKHLEIYAAVVAIAIILGIYFSTLNTKKKGDQNTMPTAVVTTVTGGNQSYANLLETRLTSVISSIAGAGRVAVMVMTDGEGNAELAYNKNEKTVTQTGTGGQEITTTTREENLILQNGCPVVLWTNPPAIVGIVVVATGASDVKVRLNIMQAVETIIGTQKVAIQILSGI